MTLYWARLAALVNGVSDGPAFGYCGSQTSTSKLFLRPSSWIATSASSIAGWRNEPSPWRLEKTRTLNAGLALRTGADGGTNRCRGAPAAAACVMPRSAGAGVARRGRAAGGSRRCCRRSACCARRALASASIWPRSSPRRAIAPALSPASAAVLASAIFARRLVTVAAGIVPAVPYLALSASRSAIEVTDEERELDLVAVAGGVGDVQLPGVLAERELGGVQRQRVDPLAVEPGLAHGRAARAAGSGRCGSA